MAGGGTGYPMTFRCAKCKRFANTWDMDRLDYAPTVGTNIEATGRKKPPQPGRGRFGYGDAPAPRLEYRCRDCGHVGWSTHEDVRRALRRKLT